MRPLGRRLGRRELSLRNDRHEHYDHHGTGVCFHIAGEGAAEPESLTFWLTNNGVGGFFWW
jgi:hypothetical protein